MSFLPIRVLVIEEHPFKRLVATQVFREVGCEEVAAVTDVAAAVELLERTGPVDIALCNLKDEGAHGLRAIEVLGRGHWLKRSLCSAPMARTCTMQLIAWQACWASVYWVMWTSRCQQAPLRLCSAAT